MTAFGDPPLPSDDPRPPAAESGTPAPGEVRLLHDLKVWPPYFDALADGSKPFEVRSDDRGIEPGDLVRLREWDLTPRTNPAGYSGREVTRRVTYVLRGLAAHQFGVAHGYCVLGLASLLSASPASETERQAEVGDAHAEGYWKGYDQGWDDRGTHATAAARLICKCGARRDGSVPHDPAVHVAYGQPVDAEPGFRNTEPLMCRHGLLSASCPACRDVMTAEAYCRKCNHGGHHCYGCGIGVAHGTTACASCERATLAGSDTAETGGAGDRP